jgi:hypothetical protein
MTLLVFHFDVLISSSMKANNCATRFMSPWGILLINWHRTLYAAVRLTGEHF